MESLAHIVHLLVIQPILELYSKAISFPFKSSAGIILKDAENLLDRSQDHLEDDEGDNCRRVSRNLWGKVKGAQHRWCVDKRREQRENAEYVDFGENHHLSGMKIEPVTEFVRYDSLHFFRLGLFDERVEDNNMFAPGQAEEVGIAVRATLGAVDLVQVLEGEAQFARKVLDACAKLAIRKRGNLVEEWLDDGRVYDHNGELEGDPIFLLLVNIIDTGQDNLQESH